jgi:hypothetical protein
MVCGILGKNLFINLCDLGCVKDLVPDNQDCIIIGRISKNL